MNWSAQYVGVPFADRGRNLDGCDCWGLAVVVYARELGIALPSYADDYDGGGDLASLGPLIAGERTAPPWRPISEAPQAFDLAIFRRGRCDSHIGLVIDQGLMLHIARGDCAKVEAFDGLPWRTRLTGFVRYEEVGDV